MDSIILGIGIILIVFIMVFIPTLPSFLSVFDKNLIYLAGSLTGAGLMVYSFKER